MSDIVERLRDKAFKSSGPTMEAVHTKRIEWEAADTIEALRAENARLLVRLEEVHSLKVERDVYKKTAWEYYCENVALRAEMEELRKSKLGRLAWYKMRDEEECAEMGESDD